MIFFRLVCFLLTLSQASVANEKSLTERYPNRLITPDYGIVTADDLAYDVTQRDAVPYDPNKDRLTRYWQCLPIKGIEPKYRTWIDPEAVDYPRRVMKMCDLEIHVRQPDGLQIYGDRRAHPNEYCEDFDRHWKKLTRGEEMVCFNGDWGNYEQDEVRGKYRGWTWNKVKTHKGCYSYFGDCNVKGCAMGKCP
jgi:hypothetical protein